MLCLTESPFEKLYYKLSLKIPCPCGERWWTLPTGSLLPMENICLIRYQFPAHFQVTHTCELIRVTWHHIPRYTSTSTEKSWGGRPEAYNTSMSRDAASRARVKSGATSLVAAALRPRGSEVVYDTRFIKRSTGQNGSFQVTTFCKSSSNN